MKFLNLMKRVFRCFKRVFHICAVLGRAVNSADQKENENRKKEETNE